MDSLFIFRNDLRITDNTALTQASKNSREVFPIFIFNKKQVDKDENEFYNPKIIAFMLSCLKELKDDIATKGGGGYCNFFYGENLVVIKAILQKNKQITNLYLNADYTPFSIKRDLAIKRLCKSVSVGFHSFHDRTLHQPEKVLKPDNAPYTVFTPYYNKAKTLPVREVSDHAVTNFSNKKLENEFSLNWEQVSRKLGE